MATPVPQRECRETTRSLLSSSATAPEGRPAAGKAISLRKLPTNANTTTHQHRLLQQRLQRLQQQRQLLLLRLRPQLLPQPRLRYAHTDAKTHTYTKV